MIARDYVRQRFQGFGFALSDADVLDICLAAKASADDEMNENNSGFISVAIAKFIPSLLLRASSVNENGFSMSWNTQGIKEYYSYLCRQYGIEDELNEKPKVTFL